MNTEYPQYTIERWIDTSDEAMNRPQATILYGVQIQLAAGAKLMRCCRGNEPLIFDTLKEASAAIDELKAAAIRKMDYSEMNVQQRAEYLLAKGVEAMLDIDPGALAFGYAARVIGMGKLPCGYHDSEQAAIDAGTAWLRSKAMPPND